MGQQGSLQHRDLKMFRFPQQDYVKFGLYTWQNRYQPLDQLKQYQITLQDERTVKIFQRLFLIRRASDFLVKAKFFDLNSQTQFCSSKRTGILYLQNDQLRLSDITDIPFPDYLHLYSQILRGYQQLYQQFGAFTPQEEHICINSDAKIKVWIHKLLPSMQPQYVTNSSAQTQMLRQALYIARRNVFDNYNAKCGKKIQQYLETAITFKSAIHKLNQWCKSQNIMIPVNIQCVINNGLIHSIPNINEKKRYKGEDLFSAKPVNLRLSQFYENDYTADQQNIPLKNRSYKVNKTIPSFNTNINQRNAIYQPCNPKKYQQFRTFSQMPSININAQSTIRKVIANRAPTDRIKFNQLFTPKYNHNTQQQYRQINMKRNQKSYELNKNRQSPINREQNFLNISSWNNKNQKNSLDNYQQPPKEQSPPSKIFINKNQNYTFNKKQKQNTPSFSFGQYNNYRDNYEVSKFQKNPYSKQLNFKQSPTKEQCDEIIPILAKFQAKQINEYHQQLTTRFSPIKNTYSPLSSNRQTNQRQRIYSASQAYEDYIRTRKHIPDNIMVSLPMRQIAQTRITNNQYQNKVVSSDTISKTQVNHSYQKYRKQYYPQMKRATSEDQISYENKNVNKLEKQLDAQLFRDLKNLKHTSLY